MELEESRTASNVRVTPKVTDARVFQRCILLGIILELWGFAEEAFFQEGKSLYLIVQGKGSNDRVKSFCKK